MLRRLLKFIAAALLLTAVAVVVSAAFFGLRHGSERLASNPVGTAIVLGGGIQPEGVIDPGTQRRVKTGVALLGSGSAERLIMSGGNGEAAEVSAAALMRDLAVSLGAPADAVLLENEADSTFENLRFALPFASADGADRLALVTDDYHLMRAWLMACYFGRCDIALVAVPALRSDKWLDVAQYVLRETLAWWYNLGKVAAWSAMQAAGVPEERREQFIQ